METVYFKNNIRERFQLTELIECEIPHYFIVSQIAFKL